MSVTHLNHMSSIVPRIPDGAAMDGTSMTIGPSDRSTKPQKYTVSQLPVRNSDAESISSENNVNELSSTPAERKPRRMAESETPGIAPRNACTACWKSRLSYSSAAVSFDGAPSSNSSVPSLVSTVSGVVIDAKVSAVALMCGLLSGC
jgi:hypothetical protein